MKKGRIVAIALLALGSGALLSGCLSNSPKSETSSSSAPAAKPTGPAPGMNSNGEVVDSKLIEAGRGQTVKGIDGWEGEITGKAAPKSKFSRLQIGMSMRQVMDIAGQPSDQGAYVTGKAWIPFYFGSDRYRHEMVYKGQGRLIFAGGSVGDYTSGHLIWIIHNANEPAYR
jgi:hypothetical protein